MIVEPQDARPVPIERHSASGRRRIRVLFYLFFPGGGIGRYTHELLEHFYGIDDIDVELICLPSYECREKATYHVQADLREIGHHSPLRRRLRFLIGQFVNPRRLIARAIATQADIVHLSNINHLTFSQWGGLLNRSKLKVTATAHDVRRAKAMINRRYEERQLRAFYRRADALFVHSQVQVADLIDFCGVDRQRIHVVPMGQFGYERPTGTRVELRKRFNWPLDKQVALSFGQLRDEKNLGILISALAKFQDRCHLVVAGRGAGGRHLGIDHYRRMADYLGVADAVTFLDGYIPEEQVADLFEASDWVALPYSRTFTSQSGVLNVAATYERPILASAAGTFAETLQGSDIGVLVEPDDESALIGGVGTMLDLIDKGAQFDFARYHREYSWRENVRRTAAVYRKLVNINGRSMAGDG